LKISNEQLSIRSSIFGATLSQTIGDKDKSVARLQRVLSRINLQLEQGVDASSALRELMREVEQEMVSQQQQLAPLVRLAKKHDLQIATPIRDVRVNSTTTFIPPINDNGQYIDYDELADLDRTFSAGDAGGKQSDAQAQPTSPRSAAAPGIVVPAAALRSVRTRRPTPIAPPSFKMLASSTPSTLSSAPSITSSMSVDSEPASSARRRQLIPSPRSISEHVEPSDSESDEPSSAPRSTNGLLMPLHSSNDSSHGTPIHKTPSNRLRKGITNQANPYLRTVAARRLLMAQSTSGSKLISGRFGTSTTVTAHSRRPMSLNMSVDSCEIEQSEPNTPVGLRRRRSASDPVVASWDIGIGNALAPTAAEVVNAGRNRAPQGTLPDVTRSTTSNRNSTGSRALMESHDLALTESAFGRAYSSCMYGA
jgi:hypothetical protein